VTVDQPLRVVVVDDSDDFRLIFRLLVDGDDRLEIAGEACQGEEAISVCDEVDPEVVVLDLDMPTMDGAQALPIIHRRCPDARIFVFSAVVDRYDAASLAANGAERVLVKGEAFTQVLDALAGEDRRS
jgi:DNA-binding NarL/FixJ family response regulator